ncbi:unnamed protein product [Protopolystoma xenopodis]|uniref:Uncharacterized protein n=1 Tax=Protopolystoma xenopodis TaxID=117903 RepID=A0A448WXU6_9PLAT|nr:unnamed protein product [Protopolystoma xenopodis]
MTSGVRRTYQIASNSGEKQERSWNTKESSARTINTRPKLDHDDNTEEVDLVEESDRLVEREEKKESRACTEANDAESPIRVTASPVGSFPCLPVSVISRDRCHRIRAAQNIVLHSASNR